MDNIEIINIALSHLGAGNIQNLTEGSNESKAANVYYDITRRAVLQKYNWSFATKVESLALLTEQPRDFAFAYQLPTDMVKVINIVPETEHYYPKGNSSAFEIRGTQLLTDVEDANIVYVYDDEDTNTFDDMFINAFSHYLASQMAIRITKDRDLQITELEIYNSIISEAGASTLNQDKERKDENPYVTARGATCTDNCFDVNCNYTY